MTSETSESGGSEGGSSTGSVPPETMTATTQPPAADMPMQSPPQAEGRRTQLKVVRENIESLSGDLGSFRRNHEASIKRLEAQLASLRKQESGHAKAKDVADQAKSHQTANKRLEKQVATLREELAAMRKGIAKDAARSRAKEEATLARILAKISPKPKAKKSSRKR